MLVRRSAELRRRAVALINRMNIRNAPVPVERMARALGAELRYKPFEKLSGMIYIKDGVPIIGINVLHHPNRQRYTIAHEIGHLELHRELITTAVHVDKQFPVRPQVLSRDSVSSTGTDWIEIEANQFAAELLMPKAFLEEALAERSFDIDDQTPVVELAKKFRVSKQALEWRMRNLNY
jgi:Zn-dependent peptidase ImmA (M78 family)